MTEQETNFRQTLRTDAFARYFNAGYQQVRFSPQGSTQEVNRVDTLYVNLLMWKPLLHVLVHRALWDEDHLTIFTNYELKHNGESYSFEEFCREYNRVIHPIVSQMEDEDLHPNAKRPLTPADLRRFYDFCIQGNGSRFIRLKTTYNPELERLVKEKRAMKPGQSPA